MKKRLLFLLIFLQIFLTTQAQTIINHSCTDLSTVPEGWISAAKNDLHVAYGHTSHGSQVTDGMSGLVTFTGGVGGPQFDWNNGGYDGALDLHDYAMGGDCGYYPDWVNNTRAYLDDPANADVNVIIWSWCGQISTYSEQELIDKYINPMVQLETDYPGVKFVYMTGHLYFDLYENTTLRNQQLRDFCLANNKILFDFADIESYDPDGVYYPFANDNCDYYENTDPASYQGNWAINWQNSHVEGVDWYNCGSAHSQPLNANRKAYAAWNLWARLAGWSGNVGTGEEKIITDFHAFPNPVVHQCVISYNLTDVSDIEISITDINGCVIDYYFTKKARPGDHQYIFERNFLPAGLYIVKLQTDQVLIMKKIILL